MKQTHPTPEQNPSRMQDPALCELIAAAQDGSREAYLALRSKYRPLIEASVSRFATAEMTDQEREDLFEEADRVFLSAVSSFDIEQDAVDFGLYAKICLRNGLVSAWRHLQTLHRRATLPLCEELASESPAVELEEEERFLRLRRTVSEYLSEFENRVWWQYVTGVSVSDIARELGREERAVHNAVYRIRKKLRKRLSSDGK